MKKATALMKHIVALLSSMAKAKSIAIKNKTSAFKTRVLMLSLAKHKTLGFRSISNKIHNFLGHADQDNDNNQDQDKNKAIVVYNSNASTMAHHGEYDVHEDNDKYPDLRNTLFEGEEDFGDLEEEVKGSSVIDMVRHSKEEEGDNFKLEDEIDHVADLFISRFHKQMKLQKLLSFKRYQEMLARGT